MDKLDCDDRIWRVSSDGSLYVFSTTSPHLIFSLHTQSNAPLAIKETYAPAILRAKAAKKRKQTNDSRWHCRYDEKKLFWPLLRENLYRPLSMAFREPICIFWNVYIALVYGVLYLCFCQLSNSFRRAPRVVSRLHWARFFGSWSRRCEFFLW